MTLVVRATGTITSPRPGSVVIPPPSLSGVIGRWDARSFALSAAGTPVTLWPDLSGLGRDLTPNGTVTAVTADVGGRRGVRLTGTGSMWTGSTVLSGVPDDFTIGGSFYLTENASPAVAYIFSTIGAGTSGNIAAMSAGTFRAYGVGTTLYPQSATVAKPGWYTVIASFDYDGDTEGTAKIKVGTAAPVTAPVSFTSSPTSQGRTVRLTGNGLPSGLVVDRTQFIDRYCTDADLATLAADLTPA